jgi:hypothetical protein
MGAGSLGVSMVTGSQMTVVAPTVTEGVPESAPRACDLRDFVRALEQAVRTVLVEGPCWGS